MKRLLVFLVLTTVVLAGAASPAYAQFDRKAGGNVVAAGPHTGLHSAAIAHGGSGGGGATRGGAAKATMVHVRGIHVLRASRGGTSFGIAALLVLVSGGAVYALVADRRRPAPALPASAPARLSSYQTAAGQRRKAA
jgi:hypothetical protein